MEEKILIAGIKSPITELFIKYFRISIAVFIFSFFMIIVSTTDDFVGLWAILMVVSGIVGVVSKLSHWWMSNCEITVTNKRVYGICVFSTRVDLPIDSISAVGMSFFKGVDIGTSSGRIHFKLFDNNMEIHSEISKLLLERQQGKQNDKSSDLPDELKKFKELLNDGIITQEEFDAKKKQLLGL